MPNIDERERYFQKVINRWENEGGAIAKNERLRPELFDDRNAAPNPTIHPSQYRSNADRIEQNAKVRHREHS